MGAPPTTIDADSNPGCSGKVSTAAPATPDRTRRDLRGGWGSAGTAADYEHSPYAEVGARRSATSVTSSRFLAPPVHV